MRSKISPLPLRWRLTLGFLLTDELFAICGAQSDKQFNRWYALGAGLSFYLIWNLASLVGIVAAAIRPISTSGDWNSRSPPLSSRL